MADKEEKQEDNKQQENASQEAVNVADLSVPTIIAALHQNAVNKSNAQSKGLKVTNSAIDVDSGKPSLTSAGEHIISVLPLESGKPVVKKDAVEILKAYVQWFVGPDLAKKVDDSTVKSLDESPEQKKEMKESKKFMSFKQFLLEADDQPVEDSKAEAKDSQEDKSNDTSDDASDKTAGNEDSKDDNKEEKDSSADQKKDGESDIGFYIPYSMKVEGLKQTALKDAMKKFATTMFDNLTISTGSLFGGGGKEFSVKDAKEAIRGMFGPIDPDDLVDKVDTELKKRYPSSNFVEVKVRDKTTLMSDLDKVINAQQKSQINNADYSLWINVQESNPKKPICNTRIIADIVQSSITGLFKKFKNKITKNDVIYINNYKDQHDDTKSLEQLNKFVPNSSKFTEFMKADQASIATVWEQIDKLLGSIAKHPQFNKSSLAKECLKAWTDFKKKHEDDKKHTSSRAIGLDAIQKYFKDFIDAYKKAFDENKSQQDLHENWNNDIIALKRIGKLNDFKKFVFESLYVEAETEAEAEKDAIDVKAIADVAKTVFSREISTDSTIKVASKDDLKTALSKYDLTEFDQKFGEFTNGIAVDFGKLMNESVKQSIMSILFEDDAQSSTMPAIEEVEKAFKLVCKNAGIEKFGEVIPLYFDNNTDSGSSADQNGDSSSDNANEDSKDDESKELNEADDAKKEQNQLSDSDLNNIASAFRNKLVDIGSASTKLNIKPIAKVGTSQQVLEWLGKYGLDSSDVKQKIEDFSYAAAHVLKIPADIDGSGKLKKGSLGFKSYTDDNVKQALKSTLNDVDLDEPMLSFEQKANDNLKYNETKIPANCKVRVMFFNDSEQTKSGENGDNDSEQTSSQKSTNDNKKSPQAYVLPIAGDTVKKSADSVEQSAESGESDGSSQASSTDDSKSTDLYIIPMPGLKYKDKE